MFQNMGTPGVIFLALLIGMPIWLIIRSSNRKSAERQRIADALEKIASQDEKAK